MRQLTTRSRRPVAPPKTKQKDSASRRQDTNGSLSLDEGDRVLRAEIAADSTADTEIFFSSCFPAIFHKCCICMTLLDTGAAARAEIFIYPGQVVGRVDNRTRDLILNRVATAAFAAIAHAGFRLAGIEIGMIGLVDQAGLLGSFQYLERLLFGDHPRKSLGRSVPG